MTGSLLERCEDTASRSTSPQWLYTHHRQGRLVHSVIALHVCMCDDCMQACMCNTQA